MQIQSFKDLPLGRDVLKGIKSLGFKTPSPIQAQAIIPLLEGKDVIGQARTGTGKTAAFGIPMVESVNRKDKRVQGLVLAPTRELAIQIAKHLSKISKYMGIRVFPIYGGVSINNQIKKLRKGVHIVVATPGRLIDHLNRGTIRLNNVQMVVLDEADRMLDMGFVKDINKILSKVPKKKQTSLFSATIDRNIWKICNQYLYKPEKILVSKDEIALEQIKQKFVHVDNRHRYAILEEILDELNIQKAIIFTRTRRNARKISRRLRKNGYNAKALQGGLSQRKRDNVTNGFRNNRVDFLVATNIAARGLDIGDITHIINYRIPDQPEVYFHRIGRTARMENDGTAITFVGHDDRNLLKDIKAKTETKITEMKTDIKIEKGPPKKYNAICSKCNKKIKVPFKPDKNRPVYCMPCLKTKRRRHRRRR